MKYSNLQISTNHSEEILFQLFQIKAVSSPLPGEVDFNFRIKINNINRYILKISRPGASENYLDFQQKILQYIENKDGNLIVPGAIKDKDGKFVSEFIDDFGELRKVRLLSWVSGRVYTDINPRLDKIRQSLGEQCGLLTKNLIGFDHPEAHRKFEWDIAQSLWTKKYIHLFEGKKNEIISCFQNQFESIQKPYSTLRKSIVHNDANDNNIIVSTDLSNPVVLALVDFGDAIYTQTINDLAIACSYSIMHQNDPLGASLAIVKGYHKFYKLEENELEHLYIAIAMRLIISVTKSAINKKEEPDNAYLLISEKPAWDVLFIWYNLSSDFAHYNFRQACGFIGHPNELKFDLWAQTKSLKIKELFPSIPYNSTFPIDLSVDSMWLSEALDYDFVDFFEFKLKQLQKKESDKIIAGGYLEARPIYSTSSYEKIGNSGPECRTIHLGIDFWLPENTAVHAMLDGEIMIAVNDAGNKEYGGLVILKHEIENLIFFSLYGHLSVNSVTNWNPGDKLKKGDCIGYLGNYSENGNWLPHLHFQIMLSLLDFLTDFPGVAYHNEIEVWKSICPDPNLLFKFESLSIKKDHSNESLISFREQHLNQNLSLQYDIPIKMVRGAGSYLIDQYGKKYLDTVNNVAHVGHEHPSVVRAGQEQMALINTNTRYLHDAMPVFAKELLETLPSELNVVHFVNSGSEANELAIRMAKEVTGQKDIIASEVGYHGNSNMCIDISSYKFDGKGGKGAPEHTNIFPLPDTFRGLYQGENAGEKYAEEVEKQIENVHSKGRGVAAFIVEPIISCGGQIELPDGFLGKVYKSVRATGGLCISDEIQVGCGRMGKTYWGFQLHDVIPDIVTIGKPIGNGHPLAVVVCTQEVADKFANGMEYFNTFGGNPVSCAIGTEVLRTIKREKLQENAFNIGKFLKDELKKLSKEFSVIGDVRGQGLFLGMELVNSDKNPLGEHASYLVNRMKDYGFLMSSDGPDHNVIKIKPPLTFSLVNAEELLFYLKKVFAEDFMINEVEIIKSKASNENTKAQ